MKRATARESLSRAYRDQILTAQAMYDFLINKFVSTIHFMFVSQEKVAEVAMSLQERFARSLTIKGTQGLHMFRPIDQKTMYVCEVSTETSTRRTVRVSKP